MAISCTEYKYEFPVEKESLEQGFEKEIKVSP